MTTGKKKLQVRQDLGVKIVDEGLLILDKSGEKIHQLNATAGFAWLGLESGKNCDEIAKEVAKKFDVTEEVAVRDVKKIFDKFDALGLLQLTDQE